MFVIKNKRIRFCMALFVAVFLFFIPSVSKANASEILQFEDIVLNKDMVQNTVAASENILDSSQDDNETDDLTDMFTIVNIASSDNENISEEFIEEDNENIVEDIVSSEGNEQVEENINDAETEETPVVSAGLEIDVSKYTVPNNGSNNGVVYFPQGNVGGMTPEWANLSYSQGTIGSSGCSITSLAMVLSYLSSGEDSSGWIFPSDIREMIAEQNNGDYNKFMAPSGGAYHGTGNNDIIFNVAGYYGFDCAMIADRSSGNYATEQDIKSITKALKSGYPVIAVAHTGHFTNKGHFIVLTGMVGDCFTVNDPSHPDFSYDLYTEDELFSPNFNLNGWWVIY